MGDRRDPQAECVDPQCEPSDPHDHLARDDALAPLVAAHGPLELDPADDLFRRLVTSVVNQQVSSAAAQTIRDRVFDAVRVTPAGVLAADPATLRDAGLSEQKTQTVRALAERFDADEWSREAFADLSNAAVRDRLTDVRGVGDWTASMGLIFGLGREDVYPVGDLAVRRATARVTGLDPDDRTALCDRAEQWAPYRSYAALYLWHEYENGEPNVG